jgi:hypothetical protein
MIEKKSGRNDPIPLRGSFLRLGQGGHWIASGGGMETWKLPFHEQIDKVNILSALGQVEQTTTKSKSPLRSHGCHRSVQSASRENDK